jgi:DNA-binding NtrC family response regulator
MMKGRMLIVDDEENILLAVGEYFDFHGYDVACAHDLPEAKARLDQSDFAVVIADLRLGIEGSEGLDVVSYARERSKATKIVMLTAYGNAEVIAEAYRRGVDAFLAKPQPLGVLAQLVTALQLGEPNRERANS